MSAVDAFRSAIADSLGRAPEEIDSGRMVRFATSDRRGDTAGWAKLFDDHEAGVYGCHRQGINGVWVANDVGALSAAQRAESAKAVEQAKRERETQLAEQRKANTQRIGDVWSECVPVSEGDPVHSYLSARGILTKPIPFCVRLHDSLAYWHDGSRLGEWPAMVTPLTSANGVVVALHRTYLTTDGEKAPVPTVKKLTSAGGALSGASIRLFAPKGGVLGVAEGIETALAAFLGSGVPTVAAYSANALAGFYWPEGLRKLVVFADADRAGREAADTLRSRALKAYLECSVLTPTTDGQDWADVWALRRGQS